jgi:DNA invertase Pin-like site-specific DNA recombinase
MTLHTASRAELEGEPTTVHLRISSARQHGLPAQRKVATAFCERMGLDLRPEWVCEDRTTGTRIERDGLMAAMSLVATGVTRVFVLPTIDRLGRQKMMIMDAVEKVCAFDGVRVYAADTSMEWRPRKRSTATSYTMQNLQAAFAEYQKELLRERLEAQRDAARAAGKRVDGSPPYGWISVGGVLYEDPDEQQWLGVMVAMRAEGLSYNKIAAFLNEAGVPTKKATLSGNPCRWHAYTVQRVLDPKARARDAAKWRFYAKQRERDAARSARREVLRFLDLPDRYAA